MATQTEKPNQKIPEPVELAIPESAYQPSKADQEEAIDMPVLSVKQARKAFTRPFDFMPE